MTYQTSRRQFIKTSTGCAALGLASQWGNLPVAAATPLRRKLRLEILNPDAQVVAPGLMPTSMASCEFPPSVVTVAQRRHVFVSSGGAEAYTVAPDLHVVKQAKEVCCNKPQFAIGGYDYELKRGLAPWNRPYNRQQVYWRKNYCGTFNVDVMPADANHPEWVFSINHCENKNERIKKGNATLYLHNSINLNDPAGPDTASGGTPTGYRDYQPAYFGFVSMSYAPITEETGWGVKLNQKDMGPVIWPWSGFLTPDGKAKHPNYKNPHPHPSSLIAEDPKDGKQYIYIFTIDSSTNPQASRMIKATRAPLTSRAMPGSFMNLYQGKFQEPSLPENMEEDIGVLATRPGGRAEPIHPSLDGSDGRPSRFFVARLKRSGLFLSVETMFYTQNNESYLETSLRLSEDLIHWTDRFPVPGTRVSSRQKRSKTPPFGLYYPKFLSADGSTHYEIDESEPFYIIATKPHELVSRALHIRIV